LIPPRGLHNQMFPDSANVTALRRTAAQSFHLGRRG